MILSEKDLFRYAVIDVNNPDGADGKESAYNARDPSSIPGSEKYPGEENGYPLQSSCLENSMDMWAWPATVNGVLKIKAQMSN